MIEQKILSRGRAAILYDARVAGKISDDMFEPEFWRARNQVLGEASGRGTTLYLSAGDEQWVLRPYRRGGMVGRIVRKWYLYTGRDRTRCFREFRVLSELYSHAMPVPQPVAAWFRRRGMVYEAALMTVRIPDALTLAQLLKESPLAPETWLAIGRTVKRFHAAGLRHADLNAHNILIKSDQTIYVLDLDRACLAAPGRWQSSNLARLRRSLNKISVEEGAEFRGDADWATLLAGYDHATPLSA